MYRDIKKEEIIKGVKLWKNIDNKFTVLMLHYSADPEKTKEWVDREKEGTPKATWAKEYEIDFTTKAGKLIYGPEFCDFDEDIHLVDCSVPEPYELCIGLDFGQSNPTAAVVGAWTADGSMYIIDEYYNPALPSVSSREMFEKFKYLMGYDDEASFATKKVLINKTFSIRVIDPSTKNRNRSKVRFGEEIQYSIKEEFEDNGWDFELGINDVQAGLTRVREYMSVVGKKTKLYILKDKCPNLIRELKNYRYKTLTKQREKTHNNPEEPIKKNDHACLVGNTKILMWDGLEKQIKDIKVGDLVKTQNGSEKVIDWALIRKKAEINEVILSNGFSLKGTKDHKIYTKKGVMPIDTLRYGDNIRVLNNELISLCRNQLSLIKRNITGMVSIIAQSVDIKTEEGDYTKQCGNFITDKYQTDFMFTTSIDVHGIIESTIFNLKKEVPIYRNILKSAGRILNIEKEGKQILQELDRLQKNGIDLLKDLRGIKKMGKNAGLINKSIKDFVIGARKNMKLISQLDQNFVIRIVSNQPCGKEDVYNITVENEHRYFANGILVRNCDALRYLLMTRPPVITATRKPKTRIQKDIDSLLKPKARLDNLWDID